MLKESITAVADDLEGATLSLTAHRAALVLGGTKIMQHSAGSQPAALQPPGGGAVGYVIRTGFYSSQARCTAPPIPSPRLGSLLVAFVGSCV